MTFTQTTIFIISALAIIATGLLATPFVFAQRIMPGVKVASLSLSGISHQDMPGTLEAISQHLAGQEVRIQVRNEVKKFTLSQLGILLDREGTAAAIAQASASAIPFITTNLEPVIRIDEAKARGSIHEAFASSLQLPKNATLNVLPNGQLLPAAGASGEQIDTVALAEDIRRQVASETESPITGQIITAQAPVLDTEVAAAQELTKTLLREGLVLKFQDQEFTIKPFTIRRLLEFAEQPEGANPTNTILGVRLNEAAFKEYLTTTIDPEINRQPVNARFELKEGKVEQFAVPQDGQAVNGEVTTLNMNAALAQGERSTDIAVDTTPPDIKDAQGIEKLGVTTLLATGESDFRGSPKNRVHNIEVGSSKYHGILIPPQSEFSFLQYLGPVDGAHNFKPELVIKQNVTIPEFGGGLCQVSSTAFRAAIQSGLKITERRNHSYAVRYYGTPGFDATIYPPYTDLRFLNNTPAYILIQTKIEGTKLLFEFWGTDDGRRVTVDGPSPYNRQPDGAVKATLKQTVISADEQPLIEDTFYSNYKSPNLFPKTLAANGETSGTVAGATTSNDPKPTSTPTPAANPR